MNFLKKSLPNIHNDGYAFVCIFVVVSVILGMVWAPLSWICAVLTLWCIYFFRDPERIMPVGEDLVLSPADGVVQKIEQAQIPEELDMRMQLLKGQYQDAAMQAELDKPESRQNIASRLLTEKTIHKLVEYATAT